MCGKRKSGASLRDDPLTSLQGPCHVSCACVSPQTSKKGGPLTVLRLFRPAHIAAIGTFQDGGLKHNNPIKVALWESLQIWPSIVRPDVVVSLGTGTEKSTSPRAPDFRNVFQDGFIPRLYRSWISIFDGQSAWRDVLNLLDPESRENYFRLDVDLSKGQSTIDDVDRMSEIREQVNLQPRDQDYLEIAFALMASSFFFEVKNVEFRSGAYHCQGFIRCRLASAPVEQLLRRLQLSAWTFTTAVATLGYYEPAQDYCTTCHRYQLRVDFWVRHPADNFTIYLQGMSVLRRKISAFPQSIDWFVAQQSLNADFGTPVHGSPGRETRDCRPNLKRKSSSEGGRTTGTCKRPCGA